MISIFATCNKVDNEIIDGFSQSCASRIFVVYMDISWRLEVIFNHIRIQECSGPLGILDDLFTMCNRTLKYVGKHGKVQSGSYFKDTRSHRDIYCTAYWLSIFFHVMSETERTGITGKSKDNMHKKASGMLYLKTIFLRCATRSIPLSSLSLRAWFEVIDG